MPINVGKNLEIENGIISATQDDLFKKLNVAYGWTHTQTTSSGGTAVVLINDGDVLTTMQCNDINKCKSAKFGYTTPYCKTCIIDGKLYLYRNSTLSRVGSKSDYVDTTDADLKNSYPLFHATDLLGKLWYISTSSSTETQVGNDIGWKLGSGGNSGGWGRYCCAVRDGKMYLIDGTSTPTQVVTTLTNITDFKCVSTSTGGIRGYIINDGYLYYVEESTATLIGSNNNWNSIVSPSYNNACVINNSGNLYYCNRQNIYDTNVTNCVKACLYDTGLCFTITTDGKLSLVYNLSTSPVKIDISNNIIWNTISDAYYPVSSTNYYLYAISDERLYKINVINATINNSRSVTYTQIGTEYNYRYVNGVAYNAGELTIAWTGDATSVSHTVYTTKSPQINDKTYSDEDLNGYSVIQSVGSSTITDVYRTYTRDSSKDTSFTAIPPATMHETVSTIDFLRITNPND